MANRQETEEQTTLLAARYRAVFANPAGIEVLTDLLLALNYYDVLESDDDVARYNGAIHILTRLGVFAPEKDLKPLTTALLAQGQ